MEPTLKDVYNKLLDIEGAVREIETGEEFLIKQEGQLDDEEKEQMELLRKLHGKYQKKRFNSIQDWKAEIWDNCPDKQTVEGNESFDFICKKTGKSCRFVDCYRNKVD